MAHNAKIFSFYHLPNRQYLGFSVFLIEDGLDEMNKLEFLRPNILFIVTKLPVICLLILEVGNCNISTV